MRTKQRSYVHFRRFLKVSKELIKILLLVLELIRALKL